MIYVMLPAYNEDKTLPLLLESFFRLFKKYEISYKVVIVDDGSTDCSASIAEQYSMRMPIELLKHGDNKGLGAAMRTGLSHIAAISSHKDRVVTMDADNTHNPEILLQMLDKVEQDGADVVIASRYETGGDEVGLALHRKILSRGASFLLALFFRVKGAKDYTCGYRLYRSSVIKNAFKRYGDNFIVENSFVCMAEILIKAAYLPAKVAEVPLVLRYDLKQGSSKMQKLQTIMRYFRFIVREKRNKLRPSISETL
jgi:dolichol-phosphate mannosyltransferase